MAAHQNQLYIHCWSTIREKKERKIKKYEPIKAKEDKQTNHLSQDNPSQRSFLEFYFVPIDIEEKQNTKNCEYKKAQS